MRTGSVATAMLAVLAPRFDIHMGADIDRLGSELESALTAFLGTSAEPQSPRPVTQPPQPAQRLYQQPPPPPPQAPPPGTVPSVCTPEYEGHPHMLSTMRRRRANAGHRRWFVDKRSMLSDVTRPLSTPTFCTTVHDAGEGFYDVDLYCNRGADDSVPVGRISFIARSPTEAPVEVERFSGQPCAELKHLDIVKGIRGFDGGNILMRAMSGILAAGGSGVGEYVLLHHDDRGSGKLVKYYERLGFLAASDVFPSLPMSSPLADALSKKHMIAPLDELVHALGGDHARLADSRNDQ